MRRCTPRRGRDGLVGLGGGSSLDTAKSIGVVARHGGSIVDYEWGHEPLEQRIPPLVAIPTTAGTGSEVTLWAVITDHERKIKFNVGGTPLIGAHVALIDPELMLGLPPAVTAATGHGRALARDRVLHVRLPPAVQRRSRAAGDRARRPLAAPAVETGSDVEARTHMAHAATLGGMAYGTESAGAAHAMSQSAGGVHDCPHGALTARVLGPVMEYNAPADPVRHARIAQGLGVDTSGLSALEAALAGVEELYRLTDDVGIPTMEELGFSEDEIPMLARIAFEDPQTTGNAREVDVDGLRGHLPQRLRAGEAMSVTTRTTRWSLAVSGWSQSPGSASRPRVRPRASRSAPSRRARERTRSERSPRPTRPAATGRRDPRSSAPPRSNASPT